MAEASPSMKNFEDHIQIIFRILKSIFTDENFFGQTARYHKRDFVNAVLRFKELPEKPKFSDYKKARVAEYRQKVRAYNQAVDRNEIYTELESFLQHKPIRGYPWKERPMTVEELNQAFTYENFKDWVCATTPYKKLENGNYEFYGKEKPEKFVQNYIFNRMGSLAYSVYMQIRSASQGESKRDSKVMLRM